jgi:hypothetical protein
MRSCAVFYVLEFEGRSGRGKGGWLREEPLFQNAFFSLFQFHFISMGLLVGNQSRSPHECEASNTHFGTYFGEDVAFIGLVDQRVEMGLRNW